MAGAQPPIWGIHAGKTGDADKLFFTENVVAIGWQAFGDLAKASTREQFKAEYLKACPGSSPMHVANSAGQLYRFACEMSVGDLVAYPSKVTRKVHVAKVTGPYQYRPDASPGYPNQRPVEWLKEIERTKLSAGLLMELGSAMSLFTVRNHIDELRAAIEGKAPAPTATATPEEAAEAVAEVPSGFDADEAEQLTRDFILKRLSQKLKGLDMEDLVKHLLELMGYRVRKTFLNEPAVDLIAHRDVLGLEPPIIKVQVKSGDGSVGDPELSALAGKVGPNEYGVMVTLGGFTQKAMSYASGKPNLRLIDKDQLVDMILDYYEGFDPVFKAVLPLRRVYIPQLNDES